MHSHVTRGFLKDFVGKLKEIKIYLARKKNEGKPGMVAHTFNPSTEEPEAGESL